MFRCSIFTKNLKSVPGGVSRNTPNGTGGTLLASDQPEHSASRWLLDNGMALPTDRIELYRGDMLCMHGIVGELAKLMVEENDKGTRFRLRRYKPFSRVDVGSPAAETPSQVHPGLPA